MPAVPISSPGRSRSRKNNGRRNETNGTRIPAIIVIGYKSTMNRIIISLEKLVVQFQDGSKTEIPMWLIAAALISLAGLALFGMLTALATIRRLNGRDDRAATGMY